MKNILLVFMGGLFAAQSLAQVVKKHNVVFDFNTTELTDAHKAQLDNLTATMEIGNEAILFPLTYDSLQKKLDFARPLMEEQARGIREYVSAIGFEIMRPPCKAMGHQVFVKYSPPDPADFGMASRYPVKESQFFRIDPTKDTVITGAEGTLIGIPAGSFMTKRPVKVELKEYYALGDYVKGGLATVSNGVMIQSGGTIYLNVTDARYEDKQVSLNPDQSLMVSFAQGKDDSAMQVFVKDPDSKEMNWVLPESSQAFVSDTQYYQGLKISFGPEGISAETSWKEAREKPSEAFLAMAGSSLELNDLGWINCDRFPMEPKEKLRVLADMDVPAEYYLVFEDIKGIVPGNRIGSKVHFGKVPKNRKAILIAASFFNGEAWFYEKEIVPGRISNFEVRLEKVEANGVDERLAMLGE